METDFPISEMIRSRRRTLSLEIKSDGGLVVRAPFSARETVIRAFIRQKRDWIEKASREMKTRAAQAPPRRYEHGETFLYLGNSYPLHIAEDMHGKLLFEERFILAARHRRRAARLFERWYREEAFAVFTRRCRFYAAAMDLKYRSIDLSTARRRWGSCSKDGRLRLNWRLVMAPLDVIDYVVVHELAHLKELNHSRRFWALVERFYPEHRKARKWLDEHHFRLYA